VDEQTQPDPPRIERIAQPSLTDPLDSDDVHEGALFEGLDWTGADREFWTFTGCAFRRVRLDGTQLRGAHFRDVTLAELDAAELAAPRSEWRNVSVTGSRLGSAELYESVWRSVTVSSCKIDYLNARTATWQDVLFAGCTFGELDLSEARVTRLALRDCRIETLTLSGARLAEVDLRAAELSRIVSVAGLAGTWISEIQLADLAPLLARHLQIGIAT
jgi:uncharacterized protein YjbI with pentapeptide repeats